MQTHEKLLAIRSKIKRWQARMKRASNTLTKLYRVEQRLLKQQLDVPPGPIPAEAVANVVAGLEQGKVAAGDLDIPVFLRRDGYMQKSPLTEAQLKLEADREAKRKERSTALAKARASKRKAKATGATRKMPLSGKEALDFIHKGE